MKIFTPQGSEILVVHRISSFENGLLIDATIMGAMPMQGVIRPADLRSARGLLTAKLFWTLLAMFFRR